MAMLALAWALASLVLLALSVRTWLTDREREGRSGLVAVGAFALLVVALAVFWLTR
jgi:hypothetical protein